VAAYSGWIKIIQKNSPEKNSRSEPQSRTNQVSGRSPKSKRGLEPLSRKETQAEIAVHNQTTVLNSSPKQNGNVSTQKVTNKNTQFGFKAGFSTSMCSVILKET